MKGFMRIGCFAAAVLMMFSACDKKASKSEQVSYKFNESGMPIFDEPITLTMMGSKAAIQGEWKNMHFFQDMEKLTNIKFEYKEVPSDAFAQKKNLAFASMELPDIFFAGRLTETDEVTYGKAGLLIPLEDLIDKYAPNLKKLMDENPNIKKSITTGDGHIYALPQIGNVPRDLCDKIWINAKWLDNLGLKMPETVDELYAVLKAFKENDPNGNGKADEIPFSSTGINYNMMYNFGIVDSRFNNNNGKIEYAPMTNNYKECLRFMKKLYSEGLLDNEFLTQTSQQMTAKGNEGRIGMFSAADAFLVVKTEDDENYKPLPPLTSDVHSEKVWGKSSGINRGRFAITKNNKYPEATMRWIDYLYSEEGGILATSGREGEDWQWTDDTKTSWTRYKPDGMNAEEYRAGFVTPASGSVVPCYYDKTYVLKQLLKPMYENGPVNRLDKDVEEAYVPYWKDFYPLVYHSEENEKKLETMKTDITTYVEQMDAKFITGVENIDGKWSDYINKLKTMKVDEMIRIYQEAYDGYLKH